MNKTAKLLQSCPTLCDLIDSSPPGSPVPGILQARTLEWVAISFSNAWKWKVKVKSLSRVRLLATSWTAAYQAPPSMGFSRQEDWSGVPLPSPMNKTRNRNKNRGWWREACSLKGMSLLRGWHLSRMLTEVKEQVLPMSDRVSVPCRRDYKCRGPEMGWYKHMLRNSKELRNAGGHLSEVETDGQWDWRCGHHQIMVRSLDFILSVQEPWTEEPGRL